MCDLIFDERASVRLYYLNQEILHPLFNFKTKNNFYFFLNPSSAAPLPHYNDATDITSHVLILPAMTWSIMATPTSCDRRRPWEITSSLEYTRTVRLRTADLLSLSHLQYIFSGCRVAAPPNSFSPFRYHAFTMLCYWSHFLCLIKHTGAFWCYDPPVTSWSGKAKIPQSFPLLKLQ